jgi:Spy/CpxP family protein refolding chaperone
MNQWISHFARRSGAVAIAAMLSAAMLFAADEPTPAPPPAQTPQAPQPETGGRGGRSGRGFGGAAAQGGNVQGGNVPGGGRGNFGGGNFGGGGRGSFGGLNLDEKQNELLREAMQADSDELRKLYEKLQAAQKELVKAVVAEKYDDKGVREKADAVSKIQTEITVLRAKAFASVSPTLKPEQREQIENNRGTSSFITGTAAIFGQGSFAGPGGTPPDQLTQDRNLRRGGGNIPGGEPGQNRRRAGGPGGPGQ